jgi:phenylpropionate dioxygenase-like ring-hydroxylating dioxygenase large terminal subunit
LVGVPGYKEYYYEELNMEEWGLVPVAQVDSYKGLIFGTFDPEAPSLQEYLGDMTWYLEMFFDSGPEGLEIIGGVNKWIMSSNWKFAADNFCGDNYHFPTTHVSAFKTGMSSGSNRGGAPRRAFQISPGNGHGIIARLNTDIDERWSQERWPQVHSYLTGIAGEKEERLGPRYKVIDPFVGTIFPNFSLIGTPSIRVWHPRGPDKIEVWSWCFVNKDAPKEVKDAMRVNVVRTFSPGGALEQDDGENWGECTKSSMGRIARNLPFNYQLGLGREQFNEEFPGRSMDGPTEMSQRGFYRRWSQLMTANSWRDVESFS